MTLTTLAAAAALALASAALGAFAARRRSTEAARLEGVVDGLARACELCPPDAFAVAEHLHAVDPDGELRIAARIRHAYGELTAERNEARRGWEASHEAYTYERARAARACEAIRAQEHALEQAAAERQELQRRAQRLERDLVAARVEASLARAEAAEQLAHSLETFSARDEAAYDCPWFDGGRYTWDPYNGWVSEDEA